MRYNFKQSDKSVNLVETHKRNSNATINAQILIKSRKVIELVLKRFYCLFTTNLLVEELFRTQRSQINSSNFYFNVVDYKVSNSISMDFVGIPLLFSGLFDILNKLFQKIFCKTHKIFKDKFIRFNIFKNPRNLFKVIYY